MKISTFPRLRTGLLLATMTLFLTTSFAQRTQSSAQNFLTPMGIGIGTIMPRADLHIGVPQYAFGHVMYHAYEGEGQSGTAYIQARDLSGTSNLAMRFRTQESGVFRDVLKLHPDGHLEMGFEGWTALNIYPGRYNAGAGFIWDQTSVAIDVPGARRITFSDQVNFTDGNVGVGTMTTPDKLTVKGTLRVANDGSEGTDYLKLYATPQRSYFESYADDEGMYFRSTVGKKFTFQGTALNLAPEVLTGGSYSMIQFNDPDNGTAPMSIRFKDDGSPDLTIMGGRLGVNNENPTEMLDVTGNIKASTLFVDNIALTATSTNTRYGYDAGKQLTTTSTGNVAMGKGAAADITNSNYSVFLGYNAGKNFSYVTFEGGQNPLTAGKSVFVVNNQAQLHNPLLFGTFVDNADKDNPGHHTAEGSMAQLAINTHHLMDSCALTVSGAIHVGPKDLDPTSFTKSEFYKDYLLWVERGVVTEDLALANVADWSDFVFDDTYALSKLNDVEKFIKVNKHLPDVPSEAEVKKHGYSVHDMNKVLLQKVEELTLYAIEQQKEIEALKALAADVALLKEQIERGKN